MHESCWLPMYVCNEAVCPTDLPQIAMVPVLRLVVALLVVAVLVVRVRLVVAVGLQRQPRVRRRQPQQRTFM